jgi:hypothetical protein
VESIIGVSVAEVKVFIARVLGIVAVTCDASRILVPTLPLRAASGVALIPLGAVLAGIAGTTSASIFPEHEAATKVNGTIDLVVQC